MLSGLLLSAALAVPGANPLPQSTPAPTTLPMNLPTAPAPSPLTAPGALPALTGPASLPPASMPSVSSGNVMPALPADEVLFLGSTPQRRTIEDHHLGNPDLVWGGASYLNYWFKEGPSPLTLARSANGTLGGSPIDFGSAGGIGFHAGVWLNERHTFGLELSGFLIGQRSLTSSLNSDAGGSPQIVRPYTDAVTGTPALVFASRPGTVAGSVATDSGLRFSGGEVLGVRNIAYCASQFNLDFLIGGKYLDLDEYISITQTSRSLQGATLTTNGLPTESVTIHDRFRTRNQFWGGVVGGRGEYYLGMFFLGGSVKVGMGNNRQSVEIDGTTTGTPGVFSGGLLTGNGSNIGRSVTNRFAVVNELGCQIGVTVSTYARVFVGYDFFYLNNVVRPGQQIDPFVNTRFVPSSSSFRGLTGIASPVNTGIRDDFFAHGVRFGLELRY